MTNKITICTINMSQAQQNFLKDYLKEEINKLSYECTLYSEFIQNAWRECDPYNPETKYDFYNLNQLKDQLRYIKKRLKKLQAIQKEVKSCFVGTFEVEEDNV